MSNWVVNVFEPYEGSYDTHFSSADEALTFAKNSARYGQSVYIREEVAEYEPYEFEALIARGDIE